MASHSNSTLAVALVEDDGEIRDMLVAYLAGNGVEAVGYRDGAALDQALLAGRTPDVVVLDIMLPGEDGLSICRRLRAEPHLQALAIIMLTARSDEVDRIVGLEIGADDYLGKPFNPRELLARIRAVMRRGGASALNGHGPTAAVPKRERYRVSELTVDLDARSVTGPDGGELTLTSAEFELLACFVTHAGRVLSRERLMDWTRGREADAFDRTIDVQVSRLRRKIERFDAAMIKTVRNQGYILTAHVEPI